MGVVLTEHLTNYAGTFLIRFVTRITYSGHTVKDTAVNGFKAVAHIRKRTGYNHRHRIVDVRGFHLLFNVDLNDSVIVNGLTTVECLIFVHLNLFTI